MAPTYHVSTPTHGQAPSRESIDSVSSIESELGKLKSEPSDSSDLYVLNAALDDLDDPIHSVLSNSSDFGVLVDATQQAEMNNYREVSNVLDSNSSESSVSLEMPAPRTREGTVVGEKRKLSFHELSDLLLKIVLSQKNL